jgi:hypothetical protein
MHIPVCVTCVVSVCLSVDCFICSLLLNFDRTERYQDWQAYVSPTTAVGVGGSVFPLVSTINLVVVVVVVVVVLVVVAMLVYLALRFTAVGGVVSWFRRHRYQKIPEYITVNHEGQLHNRVRIVADKQFVLQSD